MEKMIMKDKQILKDALSTQKFAASNYNQFAGECANLRLRDDFLSLLKEEHSIQSEIFTELHQRGWYKITAAEKSKLNTAKTTYPPQPTM